MLWDVFKDTAIDTAKMIPFLFIAYLLIEYIEHEKSHTMEKVLSKGGKFGFVPGAVLGLVPQCGFSAMASNLYSSRVITLGTLIAVYIATSDEAIPIMISQPESYKSLGLMLVIKLVYAMFIGFLLDVVFAKLIPEKLRGGYAGDINEISCHEDDESGSLLLSALQHTINILLYIFAFTFAFGLLVELIGEQRIEAFMSSILVFQPFVTGLFGLIPNCASSILFTQLYLSKTVTFGAMLAGLSTNAGVGLMLLFKTNRNTKQNLFIVAMLYVSGTSLGLLLHLFGL